MRKEGQGGKPAFWDDGRKGNGHSGDDGQEVYRNPMRKGDKTERGQCQGDRRGLQTVLKYHYQRAERMASVYPYIRCTRMGL